MTDPFQHYLGVSADADPFDLLGIRPERCTPLEIDRALQTRLQHLYASPRSAEIDDAVVKEALREAARTLRDPDKRRLAAQQRLGLPPAMLNLQTRGPKPVPILLTPFDQIVLAILVAYGGWNSLSRQKLVAVAASHRVTLAGLLKVVSGLSDIARTGRGRLDTRMISELPTLPVTAPDEYGRSSGVNTDWAAKLLPELRGGGRAATVKLSALFAGISLLAGILFFSILFRPSTINQSDLSEPLPIVPSRVTDRAERADDVVFTPEDPTRIRLAQFDVQPTFASQQRPDAAVELADRAPAMLEAAENLMRRMVVSPTPSMASYQDWRVLSSEIGMAWPLLDHRTRGELTETVITVLSPISSTAVADEMIAILAEPMRRQSEPLDIWRGAWAAGILSELLRRPDVTGTVRTQAASRFRAAMADAPSAGRTPSFRSGAREWLDHQRPSLVDGVDTDPRAYEKWELWLAAHRALDPLDPALETSVLDAIHDLLRLQIDLSQPRAATNVLGRLTGLLDFQRSMVVRDRVVAIMRDRAVSNRSLWVFGSVVLNYVGTTWMTEAHVVTNRMTAEERQEVAVAVYEAWPAPRTDRMVIRMGDDALQGVLETWLRELAVALDLRDRLRSARRGELSQVALAEHLHVAVRINATAMALYAEQPDVAHIILKDEEQISLPTSRDPAGRAPNSDGSLVTRYNNAGANAERRMQVLRGIPMDFRTGDLGPNDASLLAREALRGQPLSLRAEAQSIIQSSFPRGWNVALAVLDTLPDVSPQQTNIDFIAQFTGITLPTTADSTVQLATRRALLEHLQMIRQGEDPLDATIAETFHLIDAQVHLMRGESFTRRSSIDHEQVMAVYVRLWRDRAQARQSADAISIIDQRAATRLGAASGPTHRFLAYQIQVLEIMARLVMSERPDHARRVRELLDETRLHRSRVDHILLQMIENELAISELWYMRFSESDHQTSLGVIAE